jgi:hypothetical protein
MVGRVEPPGGLWRLRWNWKDRGRLECREPIGAPRQFWLVIQQEMLGLEKS